jgi:hypothetical protein
MSMENSVDPEQLPSYLNDEDILVSGVYGRDRQKRAEMRKPHLAIFSQNMLLSPILHL